MILTSAPLGTKLVKKKEYGILKFGASGVEFFCGEICTFLYWKILWYIHKKIELRVQWAKS